MSQQINLFNPALVKRKDYYNAQTLQWLLFAVVALMLAAFAFARQQTMPLQKQRALAAQQLLQAQQQLVEVSRRFAPRQPSKALQEELAATESRLKARERLLAYLQQGSSANAGFAAYMRAFAHPGVQGVWLTGFTLDAEDRGMTIAGRALQPELVPQYIAKLGAESLFRGRTFAALNMGVPGAEAMANTQPPRPVFVNFMLQSTLRAMEPASGVPEKKS